MKGRASLNKQPVRRVFKTVGALLCLNLEYRWNKTRNTNRLHEMLHAALVKFNYRDFERSWYRWCDEEDVESSFASGILEVANEVIKWSVERKLLRKDLADDICLLFCEIDNIGSGKFALHDECADKVFDIANGVIFELAKVGRFQKIEEVIQGKSTLQALDFAIKDLLDSKKRVNNLEVHIVKVALSALDSIEELEDSIIQARKVLEFETVKQASEDVRLSKVGEQLILEAIASEVDFAFEKLMFMMHERYDSKQYISSNMKKYIRAFIKRAEANMEDLLKSSGDDGLP